MCPAEIIYKKNEYDCKIRPKGDFINHIEDSTYMSYKVKPNEGLLLGSDKWSIHDPSERKGVYEWIFHKQLIAENLIGLEYNFKKVKLNVLKNKKNTSSFRRLYAFEEGFSQQLLKNRNLKEGVILKFDEEILFKDVAVTRKINTPKYSSYIHHIEDALYISPYNDTKVLKDSLLKEQFFTAKELLYNYYFQNQEFENVFDLEKATKYTAISNLLGSGHGFVYHNLRFYFNPETQKLEPIGFDGNSGHHIKKVFNYLSGNMSMKYYTHFYNELKRVSSRTYIDKMVVNYSKLLTDEYSFSGGIMFDTAVFIHNAKVIKKALNPTTAIVASVSNGLDSVYIKNIARFPVLIHGMKNSKKGELVTELKDSLIIFPGEISSFEIDKAIIKKYPKSIEKLNVQYKLIGKESDELEMIIPYKAEMFN